MGTLLAFGLITNIATGDIVKAEHWRFFARASLVCFFGIRGALHRDGVALRLRFGGNIRRKCRCGRRSWPCGGYLKSPAQKAEIDGICGAARNTCGRTLAGRLLIAKRVGVPWPDDC